MIFDAHVHLVGDGWVHDDFICSIARNIAAGKSKKSGESYNADGLVAGLRTALFDPSGDKLIAEMDKAGVNRFCVFGFDYGLLTGEPKVSIAAQNRLIVRI